MNELEKRIATLIEDANNHVMLEDMLEYHMDALCAEYGTEVVAQIWVDLVKAA